MATITYHHTEDSAATVRGTLHSVVVVDTGCVTEILQRAKPATPYAVVPDEWLTVLETDSYSAAIAYAVRYADGLTSA
jgi:hypothetical protein